MPISLPNWFLQIPQSTPMVVGVSGGRDSIALLYVLLDAGYQNLLVAHINHSLRGKESDGDAVFVETLCKELGLKCSTSKVDVAQVGKDKKLSLEHAARLARHEYFAACAKAHDAKHLILAHHRNDQVETILFNILRGSAGLKGMKEQSELIIDEQPIHVLRPLLENSREEINKYIEAHHLHYREDSSNKEDFATRNRLRNEAIPLLHEIMQRDINDNVIRATKWQEIQTAALEELLEDKNLLDPQGRIHLPSFVELPLGAQRSFLHSYLTHHQVPELSQKVINRCLSIIDKHAPAKANLPGGRHFCRKEQRLFVK